jgi:hypothetical protein
LVRQAIILDDLEFINSKDKSGILKQRRAREITPTLVHFMSLKIIEVENEKKEDMIK